MGALPWTRFQARSTGGRARPKALVMDTTLAAGFFALGVASLVLGVARTSTKMLAIQCALARVPGVVYAFDRSRTNLGNVQVQFLTLATSSFALLGAAPHGFVAKSSASDGSRVFMTGNLSRMFAVWELLQDHLLTLDGCQILK
jgi:hypothetical protein